MEEQLSELEFLALYGYDINLEEYNPIKAIRKELGLSQTKFANKLTIPLRTVQAWELGERHCPDYVIRLIEHWAKHSNEPRGDWL